MVLFYWLGYFYFGFVVYWGGFLIGVSFLSIIRYFEGFMEDVVVELVFG